MKYNPGLIPEKHRVLPEYFKSPPNVPAKGVSVSDLFSFILGGALIVVSFTFLFSRPLMTVVLGGTGLILLPNIYKRIESNLRFVMTIPIKIGLVTVAVLATFLLSIRYETINARILQEKKIATERLELKRKIDAEKDSIRRDSIQKFVSQSDDLMKGKKYEKAVQSLDLALEIASPTEKPTLHNKIRAIQMEQIIRDVKSNRFSSAEKKIAETIREYGETGELLYYHALCLNKLGQPKEAVADLRSSMELGYSLSKSLHEKINPLRKRQIGSVTRCCDGTTSNATGRGACSHHGGVCNWNDPIYQTYRQY